MKKYTFILFMLAALLSGCSAIDQVNQSVNYVSEVTTYINNTSSLAQQLPELTQQSVTNPQSREQLLQELEQAQTQISQFNQIEVPAFAQDLHQQLAEYTQTLGPQINQLISQVQSGDLTVEQLNNSPIFQTIDQINSLMSQFQQFGQE